MPKINVLPLKGPQALKAFNGYSALIMGFKSMPAYLNKTYDEFKAEYDMLTDAQKETKLRHAVAFVDLAEPEIQAMFSFATDANGVPYSKVNLKDTDVKTLFEIIVAVALEFNRIDINLISEEEKKKSPITQ